MNNQFEGRKHSSIQLVSSAKQSFSIRNNKSRHASTRPKLIYRDPLTSDSVPAVESSVMNEEYMSDIGSAHRLFPDDTLKKDMSRNNITPCRLILSLLSIISL